MNANATQSLVINSLSTYGLVMLQILSVTIIIGIAYLVFRYGIKALLYDQSLQIFGIYVRKTPYKGYNRWRSKSWNIENTLK